MNKLFLNYKVEAIKAWVAETKNGAKHYYRLSDDETSRDFYALRNWPDKLQGKEASQIISITKKEIFCVDLYVKGELVVKKNPNNSYTRLDTGMYGDTYGECLDQLEKHLKATQNAIDYQREDPFELAHKGKL